MAGKFTPNPPPVLRVNGQCMTGGTEVSNALADHFSNVSCKCEATPGHQYRSVEEKKVLNFVTRKRESYNSPFTERKFNSALATCNDTAPGPNGIPYAMIKPVHFKTKLFSLSIFNRIWHDHSYPSVWELAIILTFLKLGKDKFLAAHYRPVALTSCLCKIMEKIVNVKLMWYLEKKGFIYKLTTQWVANVQVQHLRNTANSKLVTDQQWPIYHLYDAPYNVLLPTYVCGMSYTTCYMDYYHGNVRKL
ncbi:uncharacterized protein [Palaemon carinicauda]|uniref:uncharacterized protein n=1 Tax=Palaemon carinicauda TaxID=392227 RepID=UPI0035B64962